MSYIHMYTIYIHIVYNVVYNVVYNLVSFSDTIGANLVACKTVGGSAG
jgi:hypothetical protein